MKRLRSAPNESVRGPARSIAGRAKGLESNVSLHESNAVAHAKKRGWLGSGIEEAQVRSTDQPPSARRRQGIDACLCAADRNASRGDMLAGRRQSWCGKLGWKAAEVWEA